MNSMRSSLACLLVLSALTAQDSQGADKVVRQLAAAKTYDDEIVADRPSATYLLYERLVGSRTTEELVELASHESSVLRCYAVRALIESEAHSKLVEIVRAHLTDEAKVRVRRGSVVYDTTAGDLIFTLSRPGLETDELHDLAEQMVRQGSPLYAREWGLRNLRFRDGMLHVIRGLAKRGDAPAAIALARYGLHPDGDILVRHLRAPRPFDDNCRFLAAEISRDPRLMPVLQELGRAATARLQRDNAYRLRFWLRAIAAQRSEGAAKFMDAWWRGRPTEDPQKLAGLRKVMRKAIEMHPDPIYAELLAALRDGGR
ncbi:MAG: hypothetical protein NXI31_15545 [bacterium]|nr:hypothetical protein [bacterium]